MFKEGDVVKIIHLHVNGADGYGVIKGISYRYDNKYRVLTEGMIMHIETSRLVMYNKIDEPGSNRLLCPPSSNYVG